MANQWFRLYSEFANDPKVQMLSEENQRRLIMLFCFRCNGDVTLQDEELTFQLRITQNEWLSSKDIFIAKGFINDSNEVLNWDKRQYISDSSTERVAKHRTKIKLGNVTDETLCNVTVTPPEQNRTEHKELSVSFNEFWKVYPKKVGKDLAIKTWNKKKPKINEVLTALEWQIKTQQWKDGFIPNPATYLNEGRWQDEPIKKIRGLEH
jgi:hypothetical protein